MKVLILYFSGTGNTKFIAEKVNLRLEEKGYQSDCASVELFRPGEVSSYDLLVFGFPVYGYDMPDFLKSYVKKTTLPSSNAAIIYYTAGYNGGNALRRAAEIFRRQGYLVAGSAQFSMPGNDGLLITNKDSKAARRALNTDYDNLEDLNNTVSGIADRIDHLSEGNITEQEVKLPPRKLTYILLTPVMKLAFKLFEKTLVDKFRADESCVNCGLCEEICPTKNIVTVDGELQFKDNCHLCLRCIHQCPAEAIQITSYTEGKFRYKGPMGKYIPALVQKDD